jgi:hypothetical protein
MLRSSPEQPTSGLAQKIQTHGFDEAGPGRESTADLQMLMERKMSSQTVIQANARRPGLAGSILVNLACHLIHGLSALASRFMHALHESRQRQADQVIRRYRHLIDRSNV